MPHALEAVLVVAVAVSLDVALGDPPNRYHPVAWIGAVIRWGTNALGRGSPARLLLGGASVTLGVAALCAIAGWGVVAGASALGVAGLVLEAVALKSLLALRGLRSAGLAVASHLARDDMASARAALAWHLVSRSTASLDEEHVASAAIESLAENLTDSFVAPLCFYLAFGLPGAALYRAVNTADAMLGYRDGILEHFGKTAACLDDIFNLIPARLSGVALTFGAALAGLAGRQAMVAMWRDHARPASPNAGWTMAAMAGALGVRLEKCGAYVLGYGALPRAVDIVRASRMLGAGAAVAMIGLILASIVITEFWR